MLRSDLKAQLTVPGHFDADEQWVDDLQIDKCLGLQPHGDPANKQV